MFNCMGKKPQQIKLNFQPRYFAFPNSFGKGISAHLKTGQELLPAANTM